MKTTRNQPHESGDQKAPRQGPRHGRVGRAFLFSGRSPAVSAVRFVILAVTILCGGLQNVRAQNNSWIKPTSGYWEEPASWSLGVLPNVTQAVEFTNANWKALVIGTNAAQRFPLSMSVPSLRVAAPVDSFNTLLMNYSGLAQPLRTEALTIETNGAFQMQSAALEVGATNGSTLLVNGTFSQGDFSQVKVRGRLYVGRFGTGAYFFTNGTLNVSAEEIIGLFGPGTLVQYGGANHAGYMEIDSAGRFDLHGGEVTATNGITVGVGDFANTAIFTQDGGSVSADTVINGNYTLNGGTITGRMSVIAPNSFQRVNASVQQNGGTNFASAMDVGYPNRFGGGGSYALVNGVVRVATSTTFRGGWFGQFGGLHTIVSNLTMQGTFVGPGNVYADYALMGGTLSVGGLTVQTAHFNQDGGTNLVAGDVVIATTPSFPSSPAGASRYVLGGGVLSARNITVNAHYYGGFLQTGGSNQISQQLTVQGVTNGFSENYTLQGGTLAVKDIFIGAGAFFEHTDGTVIHSNVLTLNQGGWHAATGNHSLGALRLGGGPNTNSSIQFPGGSSILHVANSSAQPWASGATLYVTNWHGLASGGGDTRLYFGTGANGLTTQQLAQIKFSLSQGIFPAQILATGEVVPKTSLLSFARSGNTLTLSWGPGWTLQSSTNVVGPYLDVPGAISPYTFSGTNVNRFFKLRQ